MDFEQNDNMSGALPPQGPEGSQPQPPMQPMAVPGQVRPATTGPRKGLGWRIFFGIVLALSVMANIALFLSLIGVVAVFATGQRSVFAEETIRKGPMSNKIVVISVEGIIHSQLADDVHKQLKKAAADKRVKGLIIRVNSPGGTVSGSDLIHHEISKFREEQGKPVIAFMQSVAASGGYYTSVACEEIIAEPTAITGSIGVIGQYLVLQELLENKLGIVPVTIKSGQKKDWPSSFRKPEPEELQYVQDKIITPAYETFLKAVVEGRKAKLTADKVRQLADGSIFGAAEARKEKLIDDIGYLDDAIKRVKSIAQIEEARVVEYHKPFSFAGFLSYRQQNTLKIDRTTLYELGTPQILYLWSAY